MTDVVDSEHLAQIRKEVRTVLYEEHKLTPSEALLVVQGVMRELERWESDRVNRRVSRAKAQGQKPESGDGGDMDYVG